MSDRFFAIVARPNHSAGADALLTGSYTQSAVWYSGLPDTIWGENGQVNGNGQPMYMQDAYFNPITNQWAKPTAWSVSALIEHHFTPQFYLDLQGSVGQKWSNQGGGWLRSLFGRDGRAFANRDDLAGRRRSWLEPGQQPQLRPRVDVSEHQPVGAERLPGTIYNCGQASEFFVPGSWHGVSDGFAGPSTSPVTSDRLPISRPPWPRSESSGVFLPDRSGVPSRRETGRPGATRRLACHPGRDGSLAAG